MDPAFARLRISPIAPPDVHAASQPRRARVYAARPGRRTINVRGREQLIGPGLAVQVDIKSDDRRIIWYRLSPIAETLGEAGRER